MQDQLFQGFDALATTDLGWLITTTQEFILYRYRQDTQQGWQYALVDFTADIGVVQIEQVAQECIRDIQPKVHKCDHQTVFKAQCEAPTTSILRFRPGCVRRSRSNSAHTGRSAIMNSENCATVMPVEAWKCFGFLCNLSYVIISQLCTRFTGKP
jgi:hypothetical protein